jgi:hypothetical protein
VVPRPGSLAEVVPAQEAEVRSGGAVARVLVRLRKVGRVLVRRPALLGSLAPLAKGCQVPPAEARARAKKIRNT